MPPGGPGHRSSLSHDRKLRIISDGTSRSMVTPVGHGVLQGGKEKSCISVSTS